MEASHLSVFYLLLYLLIAPFVHLGVGEYREKVDCQAEQKRIWTPYRLTIG